jgi:hypothetical protein
MAKRTTRSQIGNLTPTTKSQESTQFPCVQVSYNIPLESSQWGLQLCFTPHCNQRFAHKVMGPQSRESPTLGISRFPFGSPRTKCHLDVGLVERHKVYYKGNVVASPKSRSWWVLWARVCLWFILTPKVFKLCINQLVVWFVQFRVSD